MRKNRARATGSEIALRHPPSATSNDFNANPAPRPYVLERADAPSSPKHGKPTRVRYGQSSAMRTRVWTGIGGQTSVSRVHSRWKLSRQGQACAMASKSPPERVAETFLGERVRRNSWRFWIRRSGWRCSSNGRFGTMGGPMPPIVRTRWWRVVAKRACRAVHRFLRALGIVVVWHS